ncbi:MAG: anthranilate phosphoribosyltransferase [Chloroflexi bacterium]|nr:anthranilate phosphoribosyltransferase [Chloroflexota bacterium]
MAGGADIRSAIAALVEERRDLGEAEAQAAMREIMEGEATPAQLAAFLVALRLKGESVDEIVGMARVMRAHVRPVEVDRGPLLDTCGTGGSGMKSFNVSTAAAFVAAGAGALVAKHGNRAATSRSGSADLLEALGAELALEPEAVAACIERTGVGFMFAQAYHPAMRHAAGPRRELGVRTVFNLLGPLTNPASASARVLGVPGAEIGERLARALARLGVRHALVVSGEEGLDEISIAGPTTVFEVRGEEVSRRTVAPADLGLPVHPLEDVRGGTAEENAALLRSVFSGDGPPAVRDFVVANAAAGLYAAGLASSLRQGAEQAREAIESGDAAARVGAFVEATRRLAAGGS